MQGFVAKASNPDWEGPTLAKTARSVPEFVVKLTIQGQYNPSVMWGNQFLSYLISTELNHISWNFVKTRKNPDAGSPVPKGSNSVEPRTSAAWKGRNVKGLVLTARNRSEPCPGLTWSHLPILLGSTSHYTAARWSQSKQRPWQTAWDPGAGNPRSTSLKQVKHNFGATLRAQCVLHQARKHSSLLGPIQEWMLKIQSSSNCVPKKATRIQRSQAPALATPCISCEKLARQLPSDTSFWPTAASLIMKGPTWTIKGRVNRMSVLTKRIPSERSPTLTWKTQDRPFQTPTSVSSIAD